MVQMNGNQTNNLPIQQKHTFSVSMTLYGTTFTFVLISNFMLIYGFYKTSRPFTIITKLFIHLSISEEMFILSMLFNMVVSEINGAVTRLHYIISFATLYLTLIISLFTFWIISFLRFLSIYKPMYRIKTRTIYKSLLIAGFVSLLVVTGMVLGTLPIPTIDGMRNLNSKIGMSLYIIMIFVNLFLNMLSLMILRRSTNSKGHQKKDSVLGNQMVIKRKKMALNTLLLITVVQFVFTFPATCMTFLYFGIASTYKISESLFFIFQCLQLSNYGINSWIVILRTRNLRKFFGFKCCNFKRKHAHNTRNCNAIELKNI